MFTLRGVLRQAKSFLSSSNRKFLMLVLPKLAVIMMILSSGIEASFLRALFS